MNGGRMYQHVQNHCQDHYIKDSETGLEVYASSTHHQMIMPSPSGLIVATARQGGRREWFDGDEEMQDFSLKDIEVVWYAKTKSLCFQPHPEFYGYEDLAGYFHNTLNRLIG